MADQLATKESVCKCSFIQRLVGDGCEACNPKLALEYANERIAVLERELAACRSAHRDTRKASKR